MLLVSALLFWLNQDSITLYCQQKYHQSCEVPGLGQSSLWRAGGSLSGALADGRDHFVASLAQRVQGEQGVQGPVPVELPPTMPVVTVDVSAPPASAPLPGAAMPITGPAPEPSQSRQWPSGASVPGPAAAASSAVASGPLPAAAPSTAAPAPVLAPASSASAVAALQTPQSPPPAPAATQALATLAEGDEVFLVGDSLMQGVAPHLANSLLRRHKIRTLNLSRQSTGLAYPGFFNWPRTVTDTLAQNPRVRLMIVFLGPNDPWDMPQGKGKPFVYFKSPQWEMIYRERIDAILEQARARHVQVIWVGPPNMGTPRLSTAMAYLSGLYQQQTALYGQHFVSANPFLGYRDEQFSATVQGPDGNPVKVRIDDGIHFTITGQKMIAAQLLGLIGFSGLTVTGH